MEAAAHATILTSVVIGFVFSWYQYLKVNKVSLDSQSERGSLVSGEEGVNDDALTKVVDIHESIKVGARSFIEQEYKLCLVFVCAFTVLIVVLTSREGDNWNFEVGALSALCYVCGAVTSMGCGALAMWIAVFSNARTTLCATKGWTECFNLAFRAGAVAGFFLVSFGLMMLYIVMMMMTAQYDVTNIGEAKKMFEVVASFGLGASTVALFGRVGGGIYTKAADVGADLSGKVIENLPEDDPRNPAVIADNVGDNVGDVAGMGADLFGSFAESTCAALVVSSTSPALVDAGWGALLFPLTIPAMGLIVCALVTIIGTDIKTVNGESDIETNLKIQLGLSSFVMTVVVYGMCVAFLPDTFTIGEEGNSISVTPTDAFLCIAVGLVGGCFIGFVTEYYTSHSYKPVREVADSCRTGAATNIIYGLSLGFHSAIVPIFVIAIAVYVAFQLAGMYGVALAALGMLGTLPTSLTIDIYGPVCDNAGGIAEMAGLPEHVRDKTDALDAAGNTTAAIGKGFAIGSAALVSLSLFGAFITRIGRTDVNVLTPVTFASLFVGAMLPYWFTAMTMKSVGVAAMEMVEEVKRQFQEIEGLLEGAPGAVPDHAKCIQISTDASLKEMMPPAFLVIFSPILTGTFFGVDAVSGLLVGALTSGVQLAISQSNSGGAWDNAKKYIEKGSLTENVGGEMIVHGKGSEVHKAAVVGDTVGDPLKDTSGPALNILMKLMAILSLVFADFFMSINDGKGLFKI